MKLNDAAIPNATAKTFAITNVVSSQAGTYKVVAIDSTGSVDSLPTLLKVNTTFIIKVANVKIVKDSGNSKSPGWADFDGMWRQSFRPVSSAGFR